VIEVDKRFRGPEFAAQFLASNNLPRMFKQCGEYLKRLFLEFYFLPILAEFSGLEVKLERTEADD